MSNPSQSESNQPPVAQGTILAGKYRVERVIGEGGMGVVVEAKHIALDERVAMKFLTANYAMHPEASARFLREARAAVKIKSEHVARVSDVGTLDTGAPYMVMEFLQGHDLSKELQSRGPLPLPDAIDFIVQGCEAIAEAHAAGIVHRDLKPANLFLTKRVDGSALVKVLDFGISKMSDGNVENLTKTMTAMGSALYMSPEQMQQTRGVDHRTDIYALGVALYELLAGKQPYYADTLPQLCAEVLTGTPMPLRQVRPDLPAELGPVLEKAYARDRGDRYSSVGHFVVALAPFAPARAQPVLERIARMTGLPVPTAGVSPTPAALPVPAGGPLLAGGGTIAMDAPMSPLAAPGALDPPTGPVRAPSAPPGVYGQAGAAGGYPAPPPYGAQAAPGALRTDSQPSYPPGQGFAPTSPSAPPGAPLVVAPSTAPNMEVASPAVPLPSRSKAPLIAIAAFFVLAAAGAGAFLLVGSAKPPPSSGAAVGPTPAETPTTPQTATATSASSATVAPTTTASASATATTEPSAKAVASSAATTQPSGGKAATGSGTKTTGTKQKSIFDDR